MDSRSEIALLQKQLISIITKCEENDQTVKEVQDLIEYKGVDARAPIYLLSLYYKSQNYFSPLHYAARNGSVRILDMLLKIGVDPNVQDRFQVTPLHIAAENGHKVCVTKLLDAGADLNPKTRCLKNPHRTSVHKPYKEGTTPLHLAVINRHLDCVLALMWYGADCNAVNAFGETALYLAAREGFTDCIMTLLSSSVSLTVLSIPTVKDDTPLHACLRYPDVEGMEDCVKLLVDRGAEVSYRNKCLDSPITLAMKNGWKREIVEYMVLKGYKLNLDSEPGLHRYQGKDPMDLAVNGGPRASAAGSSGQDLACFFVQMGAHSDLLDILASELRQPTKPSELQEKIMDSLPYLPDVRKLLSRRRPYYEKFLEADEYLEYRRLPYGCQRSTVNDDGDGDSERETNRSERMSLRHRYLLRHEMNTRRRYFEAFQDSYIRRESWAVPVEGYNPFEIDARTFRTVINQPAHSATNTAFAGNITETTIHGTHPGAEQAIGSAEASRRMAVSLTASTQPMSRFGRGHSERPLRVHDVLTGDGHDMPLVLPSASSNEALATVSIANSAGDAADSGSMDSDDVEGNISNVPAPNRPELQSVQYIHETEDDSSSDTDEEMGSQELPAADFDRSVGTFSARTLMATIAARTPVTSSLSPDFTVGQKIADYRRRCEECPSLQHLARCAIRAAMGTRLPRVGNLPVPNNVKNYILLDYKLFSVSSCLLHFQ